MKKKTPTCRTNPVEPHPDFNNLLKVLRRERPARPTLFEFFMNTPLYRQLASGETDVVMRSTYPEMRLRIPAFRNAGYDYVTIGLPDFIFPKQPQEHQSTISLNQGALITDRRSFDAYAWPNSESADYAMLDALAQDLPDGMRFIVPGPGGVLENAVAIVGYERLCLLLADDPKLVEDVFENIGVRLIEFYRRVLAHPAVGAIIGNDDWGFKSQPMLAPDQMRRLVFPWHRQIVAAAHAVGKPAILHSCGNLAVLMDDIIDDLRYDGKHSYEDNIQPVEDAYAQYGRRIAILGGLDLDFIVRSTPAQIRQRAQAMLARAETHGGYALGTGNSVPEYVPPENYFAMIEAARPDLAKN